MNLEFQQERELSTSVNPEEFQINSKYNNSLKEFLKPNINENEISKLKYGKKLKMYVVALIIKENH